MNRRVIVLDEAEDELVEAQEWYETQRCGLGEEFRDAIDEAMGRFHEVPLAASPIVKVSVFIGARRIFVKRFPYSIVFIEHEEDFWVIAFAHHNRKPGYWRHRIKP